MALKKLSTKSDGLLVGKTDRNGGQGIEVQAPEGKIIMGGGEVIINEEAAKQNCEELSRINQSTGGVAIPCDLQNTANKGPGNKMDEGGITGKSGMFASRRIENLLPEEERNKIWHKAYSKKMLFGGGIDPERDEISDSGYSWRLSNGSVYSLYKQNKSVSLSSLINHPVLFKRYPNFKAIKVHFRNSEENSADVHIPHEPMTKRDIQKINIYIKLNFDYYGKHKKEQNTIESSEPDLAKESLLLHEMQHVLQAAHHRPTGKGKLQAGMEADARVDALKNKRSGGGLTQSEKTELDSYEKMGKASLIDFFYYIDKSEYEARKAVRKWLKSKGIRYVDPLKELFGFDLDNKKESGGKLNKIIHNIDNNEYMEEKTHNLKSNATNHEHRNILHTTTLSWVTTSDGRHFYKVFEGTKSAEEVFNFYKEKGITVTHSVEDVVSYTAKTRDLTALKKFIEKLVTEQFGSEIDQNSMMIPYTDHGDHGFTVNSFEFDLKDGSKVKYNAGDQTLTKLAKTGGIITHVQYGSVVLETVGSRHYLRIYGQTWKLTDEQMLELDTKTEEFTNPLSAARYLQKLDKSKYELITKKADGGILKKELLSEGTNGLDNGMAEGGKLRGVKVTYDNGESISTSMAAHLTDEDIKNYFKVGKSFNVGSGGNDKMAKVEKVEILDDTMESGGSIEGIKKGDEIKFNYERKSYRGEVTDILRNGNIVVAFLDKMGSTSIKKDEITEVLPKAEKTKKRFGIFEEGGKIPPVELLAETRYVNALKLRRTKLKVGTKKYEVIQNAISLVEENLNKFRAKFESENEWVAVEVNDDNYWTIISKPGTIETTNSMVKEQLKVHPNTLVFAKTVDAVLAHKKVIGLDYLTPTKATGGKLTTDVQPAFKENSEELHGLMSFSKGGQLKELCPTGTHVQTLIFDKKSFSKKKAVEWAKEHGFKSRVDITESSYRTRQIQPRSFKPTSFKTTNFEGKLPEGIQAVIGCLRANVKIKK